MFEDITEEHERSAAAHDAQESRKQRAQSLVEAARRAIPRFDAQDRGQIMALAIGVKPAVALGRSKDPAHQIDASVLEARARELGGLELAGRYLVDPDQILRRVAAEPELAAFVGWDPRIGVRENAFRASVRGEAPPEEQGIAGFILGYPDSAIRYWVALRSLEERGIPSLPRLLREKDLVTTDAIGAYLAVHREDIRKQYADDFGAAPEEIDLIMSQRSVIIRSPTDDPVYTFAVQGAAGEAAPDVLELRERVGRAFRDAGFGI